MKLKLKFGHKIKLYGTFVKVCDIQKFVLNEHEIHRSKFSDLD